MAIAIFLLALCLGVSMVVAAISRCPLLRTLTLSFDSWAEHTRLDAGELS
jgi:hypothetical protein